MSSASLYTSVIRLVYRFMHLKVSQMVSEILILSINTKGAICKIFTVLNHKMSFINSRKHAKVGYFSSEQVSFELRRMSNNLM